MPPGLLQFPSTAVCPFAIYTLALTPWFPPRPLNISGWWGELVNKSSSCAFYPPVISQYCSESFCNWFASSHFLVLPSFLEHFAPCFYLPHLCCHAISHFPQQCHVISLLHCCCSCCLVKPCLFITVANSSVVFVFRVPGGLSFFLLHGSTLWHWRGIRKRQ